MRGWIQSDTLLSVLVNALNEEQISETDVIPWSSPVLAFGDIFKSRVATLGLNPSNREFVDSTGQELVGAFRRFHTLSSLGLRCWSNASSRHLNLMIDSWIAYFQRNPYNGWFKKLNYIISGCGASYYDSWMPACHLDLVPYATARKWTALTYRERAFLLSVGRNALGTILRDSPIQLLILNGSTVVRHFQDAIRTKLTKEQMEAWSLRRQSRADVTGIAYSGVIQEVSGIMLEREVLVLGFNHNIQSSFGVTTQVHDAIRDWIAQKTDEVLD